MTKSEAIDWAGNATLLAIKLNITPGAISHWENDTVPEKMQYRLWRMSAGQLKLDPEYEAIVAQQK